MLNARGIGHRRGDEVVLRTCFNDPMSLNVPSSRPMAPPAAPPAPHSLNFVLRADGAVEDQPDLFRAEVPPGDWL